MQVPLYCQTTKEPGDAVVFRCRRTYTAGPRTANQNAVKADIHPNYAPITATCSCGNVIETRSTLGKDIHLEVCSACHPFYTGKQKMVDTGGRVERFRRRFGNRSAAA